MWYHIYVITYFLQAMLDLFYILLDNFMSPPAYVAENEVLDNAP